VLARQYRLDQPAAVPGRPGTQLTAQLLYAFAQAGLPAASAGQVRPLLHRAVVLHADGQAPPGPRHLRPAGVTDEAGALAISVSDDGYDQLLLDPKTCRVAKTRPAKGTVLESLAHATVAEVSASGDR